MSYNHKKDFFSRNLKESEIDQDERDFYAAAKFVEKKVKEAIRNNADLLSKVFFSEISEYILDNVVKEDDYSDAFDLDFDKLIKSWFKNY